MKHDALNRRSRFAKPQPLQTSIILTERDYLIFQVLERHGKLSTNYLYELTKHVCKDYTFLQKRLTQLYNGFCPDHDRKTHTCKVHSYLARDWAQFNNFQARYQPAVYGLTPLARKALADAGKSSEFALFRNDPFIHQFFGGCFSASFELLAHRFIPKDEILAHAKCPKSTKTSKTPLSIPVRDPDIKHLIPDDVFGIEYEDGGFRFFAVEIDRNTETIAPNKPVKNSISRKVTGYVDILSNKTFNAHFGIPNVTILFATTSTQHAAKMIEFVRENVPTPLQKKFLFKAFPDFGQNWRVPRETLPVLGVWNGVGGEVDISKKTPA